MIKVQYTLFTDQGTPDVYVNGQYVGKVSDGKLVWNAPEYTSNVTVSLENVTVRPPNERYSSTAVFFYTYNGVRKNTISNIIGTKGSTETYTNFASGYWWYTGYYHAKTSATLYVGQAGLTINQTVTSSRTSIEEVKNLSFKGFSEVSGYNKDGSYTGSSNSVTITYPANNSSTIRLNFESSSSRLHASAT